MLKLILAASAPLLLGATLALAQTSGTGSSTKQMTSAECESVWSKAGGAGTTGTITEEQAKPFVTNFDGADTNNDSKLSQAEFLAACQKGDVRDTATTGTGTGTKQ